jgi:hypothetical protein
MYHPSIYIQIVVGMFEKVSTDVKILTFKIHNR